MMLSVAGKAELTRMASGLNITDGDDAFVSAFGYFEVCIFSVAH
jgi:hypothetical protein